MDIKFDNKYQYINELGRGGFGRVFLAKDERSKGFVAIKQLINTKKDRQDHLIHELEMISKFNHPNIVNYKHNFTQDEILYIVMEYCTLGSLRGMIKKEKITSTFIWKWMDTLTHTLQFVHENGICHHDIKPDNILFTENRTIKISDFGIANTENGTRAYLCPEALNWEGNTATDPRVDVYALGVTLLELLTSTNPFSGKTREEIMDLHERKAFGIEMLDHWQQEIILKAIAKIPEQRFQTMKDFNEAIQAKSVPILFDKNIIKAGDIAEQAISLLKKRKWNKAYLLLEYAEKNYKPSVNIMQAKGMYFLLQQRILKAKDYFEKALKWNPRLDVQKELGWINLELQNHPTAISLLSDHLHRNPSDFEAYNLLLQCFYDTNRYEMAIKLATTLLEIEPANQCFANNLYISHILQYKENINIPSDLFKKYKFDNPFLEYNCEVLLETQKSHEYHKSSKLKSKLLFMDYRFMHLKEGQIYWSSSTENTKTPNKLTKPIILIGREGYSVNDIQIQGANLISRRHCLIVNSKNDTWLYDLNSIGTFVNGERLRGKMPLLGINKVKVGNFEFEIGHDPSQLL